MRFGTLVQSLAVSIAEPSVSDAELLARFAQRGDGAAFELLVRRHAELVWRVCWSELPGDTHSAEDAFQTTFLVLARKAGSVRDGTVAGYLFRVARNAALRVRKRIGTVAESTVEVGVEPDASDGGSVALIEEVERLPDKFRLPVLLCFFEDCTHVEAANRLGLAVGTVASRLARAKERLRIRLTHRGLALPAVLAGAGVPAATVRAAVTMAMTPSAVPTLLTELTREVMKAMANTNAKWIGAGVLAALLLTGGLGMMVLTAGPAPDEPKPVVKPSAKAPEKIDDAELKKLQGAWRVTRLEDNKRGVAPAKAIELMRWEFAGDIVSPTDNPDDNSRRKLRIALEPTQSPKQITLTQLTGPKDEIGDKLKGIYELKGNTLRICIGMEPGEARPTEFKVAKDVNGTLIELERILKPDQKAPEKETPEAAELKKLQGLWRVTKIESERGVAPAKEIAPMRWEFVGTTVAGTDGPNEGQTQKMQIALDVTKSPKQITMTGSARTGLKPEEADVKTTVVGIYELKGDTLRICMASPGQPLPTEFKAEKKGDGALIKLERIPDGIRDLKDLAGEWQFLQDGKPQDTGTMEIYRDMSWTTDGDKIVRVLIALDAEKGLFDFLSTTGGKPQLGRFIWKDDKMTMYFGDPGAERPAEAKAGKGVTVAVMERVKKK